jgi:hypothetical protein
VVDKPSPAAGSEGSNPALAPKKKATVSASAKAENAAAEKAKAAESSTNPAHPEKSSTPGSGDTPTPSVVEKPTAGNGDESDVPPLQSVSNSSESEDSEEEGRMPGFSSIPINRQDFRQAYERAE